MSFKNIISYSFLFLLLIGTTQLFAQKRGKSIFKPANAKMISAVEKHLSDRTPYQLRNDLRAGTSGFIVDVPTLKAAYDLNPNDLSLKASKVSSSILIIIQLKKPIKASARSKNDALRIPSVRSVLTNNENITELKSKAAFILVRNQMGNFEIQDLMLK